MKIVELSDMVKVMERGQITLPIDIREALSLQKGAKMLIRLTNEQKITLEPVFEDKSTQLRVFLEKMRKDKKVYWTKEDDRQLAQIRKKTSAGLKKLQSIW